MPAEVHKGGSAILASTQEVIEQTRKLDASTAAQVQGEQGSEGGDKKKDK